MPSMSLEITKKTCMIGQKCPKMYALFFSFSKGKDVFLLYSKKTKKNPWSIVLIYFYLRGK